MDKSLIEKLQANLNPNNEMTIGEALTLEQAVHGVLRRALVQGSNIQLQGLDDGRVAVIIQTDDVGLVRAFEASRQRNG